MKKAHKIKLPYQFILSHPLPPNSLYFFLQYRFNHSHRLLSLPTHIRVSFFPSRYECLRILFFIMDTKALASCSSLYTRRLQATFISASNSALNNTYNTSESWMLVMYMISFTDSLGTRTPLWVIPIFVNKMQSLVKYYNLL